MTQAKSLINEAASKIYGFKVSMGPRNNLVLGVKLGRLTAMQAAKTCVEEYSTVCNEAFAKQ